MIKRRNGLLLCLLLLFLLVQGMLLVHGVEHGFEDEHEEPVCHLCIAGHGLNSLISGPVFSFVLVLLTLVLGVSLALSAPVLPPVRPRQRGPPLFS